MRYLFTFMCVLALGVMGCSETAGTGGSGGDGGAGGEDPRDPGIDEWVLVPRDRVADECGLDPDLLEAADEAVDFEWGIVRYGKLCHEYYPDGDASAGPVNATTKTLGGLMTGIAAYRTRDLERTDRKTGPLSDEDRVDHWLDSFNFNPDAQVAHVLAMVATNEDLSFGAKDFIYDVTGNEQIDRLSDIINTAIAQDPAKLGANLDEFTQRFLFDPLGMKSSSWDNGAPDKDFGLGWHSTVRDMARFGLFMLNGGVWNGERLIDEAWLQKMTHPAFEDASRGYGYLTWLQSRFSAAEPCTPAAIWPEYPHGLSEATDCGYPEPYTCDQDYDAGAWCASGLLNHIAVHPGLDMVLVVKDADLSFDKCFYALWPEMRPALVALDPMFAGDEEAFCDAYGRNAYAPDLRR